jgi:hypothetical protein
VAITPNTYQCPQVAWRLQIFIVKHGYYSQSERMLIKIPLKRRQFAFEQENSIPQG